MEFKTNLIKSLEKEVTVDDHLIVKGIQNAVLEDMDKKQLIYIIESLDDLLHDSLITGDPNALADRYGRATEQLCKMVIKKENKNA